MTKNETEAEMQITLIRQQENITRKIPKCQIQTPKQNGYPSIQCLETNGSCIIICHTPFLTVIIRVLSELQTPFHTFHK